jgi:hypothetical protein
MTLDTDTTVAIQGAHAKRNKRKKELAKQRKVEEAMTKAHEDELLNILRVANLADTHKKQSTKVEPINKARSNTPG